MLGAQQMHDAHRASLLLYFFGKFCRACHKQMRCRGEGFGSGTKPRKQRSDTGTLACCKHGHSSCRFDGLPARDRRAQSSSAASVRYSRAWVTVHTGPRAPLVDGAESALSAALEADTSSAAGSPVAVPGSAVALRPAPAGVDTTISSSSNTLRCLAQTAVCLRRCASD